MSITSRWKLALSSAVLLCAFLAACTSNTVHPAQQRAERRDRATTLVYGTNTTPGYLANFAFQHTRQCPNEPHQGTTLTARFRWYHHEGVTRPSGILAAFDHTGGTLIDPFMVVILSVAGNGLFSTPEYLFTSRQIEDIRFSGRYSTGWNRYAAPSRSPQSTSMSRSITQAGVSDIALWAINSDNQPYCVTSAFSRI
jgi:hypothetical protein